MPNDASLRIPHPVVFIRAPESDARAFVEPPEAYLRRPAAALDVRPDPFEDPRWEISLRPDDLEDAEDD